jgi:hypothetical protein
MRRNKELVYTPRSELSVRWRLVEFTIGSGTDLVVFLCENESSPLGGASCIILSVSSFLCTHNHAMYDRSILVQHSSYIPIE